MLGCDVREVGVPDAPAPREAEAREDGDEGDDGRDGDAYARAGRERAAFAAEAMSFGTFGLHLGCVVNASEDGGGGSKDQYLDRQDRDSVATHRSMKQFALATGRTEKAERMRPARRRLLFMA